MDALTNARRGTYSTRRSSPPVESFGQRDTRGQLDPGAAGVGSLFEGLLRGFLQQQMPSQQPTPSQQAPSQQFPPQPEMPRTQQRPRESGGFGGVDM
jgi:hypothetical protein